MRRRHDFQTLLLLFPGGVPTKQSTLEGSFFRLSEDKTVNVLEFLLKEKQVLRTISKALLDIQVCCEHTAHEVRGFRGPACLQESVPITRYM